MFDLGRYLPYLINRAGVRLAVSFGRELKPHGVVVQEWRVLAALAAHGSQRLSDLAALTSIDLSTLSFAISSGDTIRITRLGNFFNGNNSRDTLTAQVGVFSSSSTLLGGANLNRVPGAIDAGEDFVTR